MNERGLPDSHALQAHFNERMSRILAKYDRRIIGWDEILHLELPADTVVQSWQGQASRPRRHARVSMGSYRFGYYLDHMFPASFHASVDPLPGAELTERRQARILGGEACMWGDFTVYGGNRQLACAGHVVERRQDETQTSLRFTWQIL